jgi:GAF domain-containing protein
LPPDFVERLRDLLATVRAGQTLLASEGDRERLARVVRIAAGQTGAAGGVLYVVDEDRGDLVIVSAAGAAYEPLIGVRVGRTGLPGFAIDDGAPIAVAGTTSGSSSAIDEIAARTGVPAQSQLVAPILVFGVAAGALELRDAPDPRGFGPRDVGLAVELAHVAAAAVEAYRGERLLASMIATKLRAVAKDPASLTLVEELIDAVLRARGAP